MATNPNNAIGTNAAFGGRTSPNAFNDVLGAFQGRGIVSGWECSPDSGMTVVLGGNGTTRDVAIAEDNAGNKTTVDNIPASPISLTIAAAPATQSRIDAVVVYVNNPPQGSSTAVDNYGTVGILDVQGTVASSPVAPNDSEIRTAITTDGASGATAYYVVLAYITVASGTTTITSGEIEAGPSASLQSELTNIPDGSITGTKIAASTVTSNNIDWATINYGSTTEDVVVGVYNGAPVYRHVEEFTISSSVWVTINLARPISNFGKLINVFGSITQTASGATNLYPLFRIRPTNTTYAVGVATVNSSTITFDIGTDVSGQKAIIVFIDYTKSN